ncbi:methionyl-tRNA formyltransferase [Afifella pfennigii]|uniref:methionyl-tRNA formyltransferase n=1 Tax=Afifella pfennigii TaxID=209897 RepID=UPI00047A10D4|nr:methionyl-tRNA formyltransferase [Afifella pfennigii]
MLRIVFMGTPDFAVPTLLEVVGQGHDIAAVYTQPPRPAGRGMGERKSPVHGAAERLGLEVRTPKSLKGEDAKAAFAALNADVAVVVAYGLILPKPVLDAPELGCLNLHASLLPRWRGAAPIQRAVMAGDAQTGVMVMRMEEGLDTGPVCLAEKTPIGTDENAGQLHDRLARLGADLMVRALGALERGALACTEQSREGVTYAAKIDKAESRLDFARPAEELHNLVRGLSPFPGAFFQIETGGRRERVKLLKAAPAEGSGAPGTLLDGGAIACGEGALKLLEVQRAGRKPMGAAEFLRGLPAGFKVVA